MDLRQEKTEPAGLLPKAIRGVTQMTMMTLVCKDSRVNVPAKKKSIVAPRTCREVGNHSITSGNFISG
jgi:hypothetical protein